MYAHRLACINSPNITTARHGTAHVSWWHGRQSWFKSERSRVQMSALWTNVTQSTRDGFLPHALQVTSHGPCLSTRKQWQCQRLLCQYHSTNTPHSLIHLSPTPYNVSNWLCPYVTLKMFLVIHKKTFDSIAWVTEKVVKQIINKIYMKPKRGDYSKFHNRMYRTLWCVQFWRDSCSKSWSSTVQTDRQT